MSFTSLPDFDTIGNKITAIVEEPLKNDNKASLIVFPEADWEKSGKAYKRRSVIFSINNQSWAPPSNAASLSRGEQAQQTSNIDMFFYLTSTSLRGPLGIFAMKDNILRLLRGVKLDALLGICYPVGFNFSALDESSCTWEYNFSWSIAVLDANGGKQNYQVTENNGQPTRMW